MIDKYCAISIQTTCKFEMLPALIMLDSTGSVLLYTPASKLNSEVAGMLIDHRRWRPFP